MLVESQEDSYSCGRLLNVRNCHADVTSERSTHG